MLGSADDVMWNLIILCCVLAHIHGFQLETYNSTEPIQTVEISSSGYVFMVTGNSIKIFRDLGLSHEDLVYDVTAVNNEHSGESDSDHTEKISFFTFLKIESEERVLECTSRECFLHEVPDIRHFTHVDANTTHFPLMRTLGADLSSQTVVIDNSCPDDFCRIFSAQTTNDGVTYISERFLYNGGDVPLFASSHNAGSFFQSVRGQDFDFLHSFQGGNNVYFLRNVRQETGESHAFISQMCSGDSNFRSYMESKLECGGYPHLLAATTIQTAGGMIMFASFSLRPFLDDVTDTSQSVICTYKVSKLADYFNRALTDCFKRTIGYWPEWIDDDGESCSRTYSFSRYKCGHTDSNTRIATNTTLQMNFIKPKYHYENVVSMVIRQHGSLTRGYFGTQEGDIIKVLFNASTNTIERALKLQVSIVPVRHVTLSKDDSTLFYISGNSVGKVRLNMCDIHKDCYSCLMSGLDCVWSTDRITGQEGQCVAESDAGNHGMNQHERSCRPIVYSIEPKSGPTGGGTTVTITGQLDLPEWYGAMYANDQIQAVPVTVGLGQSTCQVVSVSQYPHKIECVTSKQPKPTNQTLRLEMHNANIDTTGTYRLIRSQGSAVYQPVFTYLEPLLDSTESSSQRVRLSGGTQLTINGSNLHIGNQHSKRITIGNQNCMISKHDSVLPGSVTCRAPAQSIPDQYDIVYMIDNNTISGRSSVLYIPDPIISDIQPRSSIISGGVHLTITGTNLIGLGRNGVMLNIDIRDQEQIKTIKSECNFVEGSDTFVCKTSPSPNQDGQSLYGRADIYNVYGVLVALNTTIYIVPDPTMEREDKLIETSSDDLLFYKGYGLHNISIADVSILVGDTLCNVTKINTTGVACRIQDPSAVDIGLREKVKCQIGLRSYDLGTVGFHDVSPMTSRTGPIKSDTTDIVTIMKVLGGAVLGVMVVVVVVFGIKRNCQKARLRKGERFSVRFQNNERVLNLQGLSEAQQNRSNDYVDRQRLDVETTDVKETLPLLLDEEARGMFDRKHLLIPSERLVIGETVGQGNFGCVYKGYLQQPEEKSERIVACKTLQRNNPKEMDVSTFLKEALIMKDFHHKNVMALVGICLGIEKLPLVVLPFMRMGDVLTYIRNVENVPTVKDLVVFSVDIANGMYYLSQLKFVHRDLAARNCMIDEDMTVKVADFGLSRDVYEKEYYSSCDKKAQLPVKWMSPESLEFGLFTTKSDVWSFGIVLWELLTRGVNPYPTVDNWDILRYLKQDRRLNKPDFCPEEMYRVMQSCWQWNADDRPTFGDLTISIPDLLRRLERASERRKHLASLSEDKEGNEA